MFVIFDLATTVNNKSKATEKFCMQLTGMEGKLSRFLLHLYCCHYLKRS